MVNSQGRSEARKPGRRHSAWAVMATCLIPVVLLVSCSQPSDAKREIMAMFQKHRDFLGKVRAIHEASNSPEEFRVRIEREQVVGEWKNLVLETRRVRASNAGKLTPGEAREIEEEVVEVNRLYLDMAGEGIKITEKAEWF